MKVSTLFRGIVPVLVFVLAATPGLILAQGGLGETLEWPERGITLGYPAGWAEPLMIMDDTYGLAANAEDLNLPVPGAPVVIIVAADTLTGLPEVSEGETPEEALGNLVASITGGSFDPGTMQAVTVAGYPAFRTNGSTPDNTLFSDGVLVVPPDGPYVLLLAGMPFDQQDAFALTFDQMLASLVIGGSAAGGQEATPALPAVAGVRITLDQTLTGSWNEIDAVELVGLDEQGAELRQWAGEAEATSEYGNPSWSAMQVTGAPDTADCGDLTTAWASATSTGQDILTVTYAVPVIPTEINIYQTYNPGAIVSVEVLPADDSSPLVVFEGVDPTTDCPGVFTVIVGNTIAYGQTVSGAIDGAVYHEDWTFTGQAGDAITATLIDTSDGDTLDPYLVLLDGAGNEIAFNDDATDTTVGPLNAQIAGFVLPADGTYTIRATRFAQEMGTSSGSYTLELELDSMGDTSTTGGPIAFGQTVSGLITGSVYQQDWTFTGAAGDVITVSMVDTSEGDTLDPYLFLLDEAGNVLIENDDASDAAALGAFNSQIAGFTLPTDGTYTIRAARFGQEGGSSSGSYDLTLTH